MTKNEIRDSYVSKLKALRTMTVRYERRSRGFMVGEISGFVVALGFVVLYTVLDDSAWTLWMALFSMGGYLAIRYFDVKNDHFIARLKALSEVYADEIRYMDGDYSHFEDGGKYVEPGHPYALDLDIFGRDSLFQRINRTVTTGGSDLLAARLSSMKWDKMNGKSQKELADRLAWRVDFMATANGMKVDTALIKKVVDNVRKMNISSFICGKTWMRYVALLFVCGLWAAILGAICGKVNMQLPVWWAILQFFAVFMLCSGTLRDINKAVAQLQKQLAPYTELVRKIREGGFREAVNMEIAEALDGAEESFGELGKILKGLDRRGNVLGLVLFNALFLMDFHLVRRFLCWQKGYLGRVEEWLDAVSTMDALVSMATFRYNEPSATDAEVVDGKEIVFRARSLRHPFLGDKGVGNDFNIEDTHYYIITGANMAGKSTFLRSIGVNYVLAMNGMPVFADSLHVSVFSLFTSMRTTDDLTHGISYFNAELLRLQMLLEHCKSHPRTLVILDEILKGTNSLDKLNGSRLFLRHMANMSVTGIVATHDLELSKMSEEYPGRFHNYCFEIELGTDVTYSYKITPGVARNQNATYLLKTKVLD